LIPFAGDSDAPPIVLRDIRRRFVACLFRLRARGRSVSRQIVSKYLESLNVPKK